VGVIWVGELRSGGLAPSCRCTLALWSRLRIFGTGMAAVLEEGKKSLDEEMTVAWWSIMWLVILLRRCMC
jgi:hypothetical protein